MLNAYQQYKEQSLSTLAPGELLVKLYEEAIKQLLLARRAMEKREYGQVDSSLTKVQAILATLADSLDMKYPVSQQLRELYIFLARQLMQSNVKKDLTLIDQCIPLLKDLRDSFEQADRICRKTVATGGNAV